MIPIVILVIIQQTLQIQPKKNVPVVRIDIGKKQMQQRKINVINVIRNTFIIPIKPNAIVVHLTHGEVRREHVTIVRIHIKCMIRPKKNVNVAPDGYGKKSAKGLASATQPLSRLIGLRDKQRAEGLSFFCQTDRTRVISIYKFVSIFSEKTEARYFVF